METHIDDKWRFKNGTGDIKFNSWDADCENPSTANAVVGMMRHKLGLHDLEIFNNAQQNANKHLTNNGRYLTKDYDHEKVVAWKAKYGFYVKIANAMKLSHTLGLKRSPERFSHDETNGVVSSSCYFLRELPFNAKDLQIHLDNLSLIEHNTSQTWYRSYDVGAATKYAKNPKNYKKLVWQIEKFAKCAFDSTDLDHKGDYQASGKMQAWIRVVGLGLDLKKVTADMPEKGGLIEMFNNFVPERDHIINVMARELYFEGVK